MQPIEFDWLRGKDLNLRPLGYEPNELPDCSTPHFNGSPLNQQGQLFGKESRQYSTNDHSISPVAAIKYCRPSSMYVCGAFVIPPMRVFHSGFPVAALCATRLPAPSPANSSPPAVVSNPPPPPPLPE